MDSDTQSRRHWGWKAYFYIVTPLYVGMASWLLLDPESYEAKSADYIDLLVYLFVTVGLFGYCFSRPIGRVAIWKAFVPLLLTWDLYFNLVSDDWSALASAGAGGVAFGIFLFMLVLVPQYIALCRYAFREYRLWGKIPSI